jgi:hypothetical protein
MEGLLMRVTKTTELAFLVRVDDSRFVIDVDGQQLQVTDVPSYAKHYSYTAADQLVQVLRRRRLRQAVVCSHLGAPVTADDLRAALRAERAAEEVLPRDQKELDRIPTNEIKRRTRFDAAFRARVNEIEGFL